MENTDHPSTQKTKNRLKVFFSKESQSFEKPFSQNIKKAQQKDNADFLLEVTKDKILLKPNQADSVQFKFDHSSPSVSQNLSSFLRFIKPKSNKVKSSAIKAYKKSHMRILNNSYSNIDNHTLSERLKCLINRPTNLETLPKQVIQIFKLIEAHSCQILYHEKGMRNAHSYQSSYGQSLSSTFLTKDFNRVFSSIQKSKNTSFDQTEDFKKVINFSGKFLGEAQSFKDFRIIVFLSNNSFLNYSIEEISEFKLVTQFLLPTFNRMLLIEKSNIKEWAIKECLLNFPLEIEVKKGDEYLLKKSSSTQSDSFREINVGDLQIKIKQSYNKEKSEDIYQSHRLEFVSELLNTLQHELSNPLFGILMSCEILKSFPVNEEEKTFIDDMANASKLCQSILNNFQTLHDKNSELQKISLQSLVEDIVTMAKSETRFLRKKVIFSPSTHKKEIVTNPTWFSQILFNLIINSTQALRNSDVEAPCLTIKSCYDEKFNQYFFEISDNGPGIPLDIPYDIFDPFYTTKEKGSGLGLTICRNLAHSLGGEVTYKNHYPKPGVTFILRHPVREISE